MYRISKAQKEELIRVFLLARIICHTCFPGSDLCAKAEECEYDSKELIHVVNDLKNRVHLLLYQELHHRGQGLSLQSFLKHSSGEEATYRMLIQIERLEVSLQGVLLDHVLQIAHMLEKEGTIAVPALEW